MLHAEWSRPGVARAGATMLSTEVKSKRAQRPTRNSPFDSGRVERAFRAPLSQSANEVGEFAHIYSIVRKKEGRE